MNDETKLMRKLFVDNKMYINDILTCNNFNYPSIMDDEYNKIIKKMKYNYDNFNSNLDIFVKYMLKNAISYVIQTYKCNKITSQLYDDILELKQICRIGYTEFLIILSMMKDLLNKIESIDKKINTFDDRTFIKYLLVLTIILNKYTMECGDWTFKLYEKIDKKYEFNLSNFLEIYEYKFLDFLDWNIEKYCDKLNIFCIENILIELQ